jgi:hypothetical protein
VGSVASGSEWRYRRAHYFQGANVPEGDGVDSDSELAPQSVGSRTFPEIRHLLTAKSGRAVHLPRMGGLSYRYPYDLGYQDGGLADNNQTRVEGMYNRLRNIFRISNADDGSEAYLGLNTTNNTHRTLLDRVAMHYALNIQDYTDNDSQPTRAPNPIDGKVYYGLEKLPFVRSVYAQAGYEAVDNASDEKADTWEWKAGSQAMAIELGNPFDSKQQADLNGNGDPDVRIRVIHSGGNSVFELPVAGSKMEARETELTGNVQERHKDLMVVFADADNPIDEGGNGDDLVNDLELQGTGPNQSEDEPTATDDRPDMAELVDASDRGTSLKFEEGVPIRVDLQFKDDVGRWITYDRFEHPSLQLEAEYQVSMNPPPGVGTVRHAQAAAARPCLNSTNQPGIHYICNASRSMIQMHPTEDIRKPNSTPSGYQQNRDRLLHDDKSNMAPLTGPTELDDFQLPLPDRAVFSRAELGWMVMMAIDEASDHGFPEQMNAPVPELGQRAYQTIGTVRDRLHLARNKNAHDSAGLAVPDVNNDDTNLVSDPDLPHHALVMEHFAPTSPATDGQDNNGDGQADEEGELFRPGTININTAPLHLTTLAASLPTAPGEPGAEIDDLQRLMESIEEYRDFARPHPIYGASHPEYGNSIRADLAGTHGNWRQDPGIASIGELLAVNPEDEGLVGNRPENMLTNSQDNQDLETLNKENWDLLPMPEEAGDPPNADQLQHRWTTDGPEELMAKFQFLSENFTTRSDIYTAYVLIRGYPADDFSAGPVAQQRFLVVFDRTKAATDPANRPEGTVRVIGRYDY